MLWYTLKDKNMIVDLTKGLQKHKDEYIYYKTDHHWTSLGAKYGYEMMIDAMGEKISIQVMGMKEPYEKRVERVRFVTIGVMWYAHSKKMAFADAYRYLLVYKGIQFLEENYAYEQTLPRETLLSDLDKVCNRNREKYKKAV